MKDQKLPDPDVEATVTTADDGGTEVSVVVSRDNKAKSYTAHGADVKGAVKGVFEKFIADPGSAEFVKNPRA